MKFKTTRKAIKENYSDIIEVGYADAQWLLSFREPFAYTYGVYGWNANIYDIDGVAIVTGYRSFGNIKPGYLCTHWYDEKAKEIRYSDIGIEEMRKQMDELLNEFIEEVTR